MWFMSRPFHFNQKLIGLLENFENYVRNINSRYFGNFLNIRKYIYSSIGMFYYKFNKFEIKKPSLEPYVELTAADRSINMEKNQPLKNNGHHHIYYLNSEFKIYLINLNNNNYKMISVRDVINFTLYNTYIIELN